MQKLRSVIKQVVNGDLLQIYNQDPKTEDYSLCIHSYQCLTGDRKNKFKQSLNRKLNRNQTNKQTINLLILCDFFSATNPQIFMEFPQNILTSFENKSKDKILIRQNKNQTAQNNFIYFYIQYLKQKIWQNSCTQNVDLNNIQQGIQFCEIAIKALKIVLKYDFIIDYVITHNLLGNQSKIAIQNVLRRSSEDLGVLIRFVDKWSHIIVDEGTYSINVNEIYEQLIYISKNVNKLQFLNRKIKSNLKFPIYVLNKKLNITIQQSMLGKQQQKKNFYSQRILKTLSDLESEGGQITQSQIVMKVHI